MKYFTLVLTENELQQLKNAYKNHLRDLNIEHVSFSAVHNNVEIIGYNSGKLMLRGEDISKEIKLVKKILNRKDYEAIGSDEVGTGDVFGPITVCAAYVSISDIEFLESLNVRDSKSVTDKYIIENAPMIAKKLTHSLIILSPEKYNKLIDEGYNLNKIKAHLHNQALISLMAKLESKNEIPVIVDQFCQPQLYFNYLKDEMLVYRDITFITKAENVHLSVAAAAIIARYAFLYSLQKYGKKIGISLVKGASKNADIQINEIHQKFGQQTLFKLVKKNFKNVTKLNL
ncbi:ribonuclease HIII [Haploplasma axanthum]|uniref:Ribonuclease HIII n=1 Tax=Haploplasma axanthum TaxID=29552 RepID=A0A449BEB1_HAPAX|nr:ribonuclease HIII [Haploplasma axanthum]VEU80794.1 ribonuclease HII [Haploplasma axanthum]